MFGAAPAFAQWPDAAGDPTRAVAGELTSKISEVKEQTQAVNSKVGEVSTEVGAVKSEVASTKSELEKTIGDLKRVRGDLGEQSGLIATNGKELQALKALGRISRGKANWAQNCVSRRPDWCAKARMKLQAKSSARSARSIGLASPRTK